MIKSILKKFIKGLLKLIYNIASPFMSKKSKMNSNTAREILHKCSPKPNGTAEAHNQLLEPIYDLQIIIPAYNVEQYLRECLDSVLSQKTKYKFVVILIDDGSTDATGAIADEYSSDERLCVIHQENRGFSGARNVGLAQIYAKYIMFVDSDDRLCEGAVEALLDVAFKNDCDVVEGGAYYFTQKNKEVAHNYSVVQKINIAKGGLHGQPWAKVYKAHLFENCCFPEGFWYEDSILLFLIWPITKVVYVIPEMVYEYRRNLEGITAISRGKPKSIDTYWVTEQLMAEREEKNLPVDKIYFNKFIKQITLNQNRVALLNSEIQESIFVLSRDLMYKYFPQELIDSSQEKMVKALKNKDFGIYKMCCKIL